MKEAKLSPLKPLADVIADRRMQANRSKEIRRLVGDIIQMVLIFSIAMLIFLKLFDLEIVNGNGMYPSLADGDMVLAFQRTEYQRNDVVFYQNEGISYCGRVIARAGDAVLITEDGTVMVNGTPQTEMFGYKTYSNNLFCQETTVPDGSYFILGDFRTQTMDSRNFGCIEKKDIKSKIIMFMRHRGI